MKRSSRPPSAAFFHTSRATFRQPHSRGPDPITPTRSEIVSSFIALVDRGQLSAKIECAPSFGTFRGEPYFTGHNGPDWRRNFGGVPERRGCCALRGEDAGRHRRAQCHAPEEKRIAFRVGINLGDVVIDGDDIYGDGVNVAARLEGVAVPGGICISDAVFDQVKNRVEAAFENLGEQKLKNIDDPVQKRANRQI